MNRIGKNAVAVFLFLILKVHDAWPEADSKPNSCSISPGAKLVALQGRLFYDPDNQNNWQAAEVEQVICEGSRIKVEPNSRASILLPNDIILKLNENTVLSLNNISAERPALLNLLQGFVHFISRTPKRLEVTTPIVNAGPQGTEFALSVSDAKASLWVYEGEVKFFNTSGSVSVGAAGGAVAEAGQAPRAQLDIKPQDAVNWALYYPSLIPYPDPGAPIDSSISTALENFRQGRIDMAISQLDALAPEKRTAYFYKARGAILLSIGRVKLASQDIEALQSINPNDAEALALLSVSALAQNQKEQAYSLAKQAVTADPHSGTAFSALSYSEQARFDLPNALAAADQALTYAPHDAMIWARKAELQLSMGLLADSEQTAKQALALDPNLERIYTVMGFSDLLQMHTDIALQDFAKALSLDSSSPLARLGMGLAKIRDGDLENGRQDLEIAVMLNPGNALSRSYLGKAYYEEKRPELALEQFKLAAERDPKDPTAYFYDAIQKLTINRPIEALKAIQSAIADNDNRAVYRSSLALDKDTAARSAAQGRIYNELSYQQLGLLEGWKSLDADSYNYSAHRLLADDYANLPRHEIARVSEVLQSQLLQPVNITPIQPNLEETSLFVLNNLGPTAPSFNEFNPLFEYNRLAIQASGIYGGNNTVGDNVLISGIRDNLSFNLSQFNYGTDGFRDNNFFKQNVYSAFLQDKVSDRLNLQFEYRHEVTNNGDLALNFDRGNYDPTLNLSTVNDSYRVGGRYQFNTNSTLIGSGIFQKVQRIKNNSTNTLISYPDILLDNYSYEQNRDGFISELQHNYTNNRISIINGFGHIDQQYTSQQLYDNYTYFDISQTPPANLSSGTILSAPTILGFRRTNVYNYSKFYLPGNWSTTIGLSFDDYNNGPKPVKVLNPKLGLVWNTDDATTLRAAIFRVLSVTDYANQTIEPTQVAGFNQFFDDYIGSVSWRYGIGLDHKFSPNTSSGLEYSQRNLRTTNGQDLYRAEHIARAYLNYTPADWLAVGLEYFYEKIRQPGFGFNNVSSVQSNAFYFGMFNSVETHRVPLTISLFDTSGFSLKFKNSFVHQSGYFQNANINANTVTINPGTSNFIVSDLSLNYRLPGRHGMVSIGANNIFNQDFNFQNTDYNTVMIAPSRVLFSRITLAF